MTAPVDFSDFLRTARTRRARVAPARPAAELVVDLFAGGGGVSEGIALALGRQVDKAVNHDLSALWMHALNHPDTEHYCSDLFHTDPDDVCQGRPVGLLWCSPDCTHFSRARGSKPVSKKIRSLPNVVLRWAEATRARVVIVENVAEIQTWGPLDRRGKPRPEQSGLYWRRWLSRLRRLGYVVETRVLNCADYGAPTKRKRLFVLARRDGRPLVWPEPTHGPGRAQPYRTAASCIDWELPVQSIFDRKKPLAENTLRRIARGIQRYVLDNPKPFIVRLGQTGSNGSCTQGLAEPLSTITTKAEHCLVAPSLVRCNHGGDHFRGQPLSQPLATVVGTNSFGLAAPVLAPIGYGERAGQAPRCGDPQAPLGTVVGARKHAVAAAVLLKHYGGVVGAPLAEPIGTVTTVDHHAVAVAHLLKFRGQSRGGDLRDPLPTVTSGAGARRPAGAAHALGLAAATMVRMNHGDKQWDDIDAPLGVVTSQGNKHALVAAFLAKYNGTAIGQHADEPLHTIPTVDRFSVVTVEIDGTTYAIVDVAMRMLQPRELARAQSFADDYVLVGPNYQQVEKLGNSVPPAIVAALVGANFRGDRSVRGHGRRNHHRARA